MPMNQRFITCMALLLVVSNVHDNYCLHVSSVHESAGLRLEPLNSQIHKRQMSQFFDKASYSFNGFEKVESVPVLFPLDICLFRLADTKYATALHITSLGERSIAIYRMQNATYELLVDLAAPNATAIDCQAFGPKGYLAIAFNISEPVDNAKKGSPILEITGNRVRAVQYFAAQNLQSVYLQTTGNDLYLLQTFRTTKATPNLHCPYFRWSGMSFNRVGRIPCTNARHLEPFSIDYVSYVAVANYADQGGRTLTYSEIYRFDEQQKLFKLFQKIRTNGAVDVRYFGVPFDEVKRQHFLIFGNSIALEKPSPAAVAKAKRENKNLQADSVFYLYERGQFVPYQRLSLYAVEQFRPVQNEDPEKFLLLVASNNQDIKIYNLNDGRFEESEAQFTEGALGRGVAKMRIYQEEQNSYLVIANELMASNETNVFLPIYKQDEHANALRQQIIEWATETQHRLQAIDVDGLKSKVQERLRSGKKPTRQQFVKDIGKANIETVTTSSLVYSPLHLTTSYWKALSYANQAIDAFETEFEQASRTKRNTWSTNTTNIEPQFTSPDTLKVNTLHITGELKANTVNGIDLLYPAFGTLAAQRVIVSRSYQSPEASKQRARMEDDALESLSATNLQISGKLNNYTWDELINNTLKLQGVQFIKAPTQINQLKATSIVAVSEEISGQELGQLVSIDRGDFVVNQDVQFAAPIEAEEVVIHNRLNNIHVTNKKFDVLMRNSNQTQVIKGPKRFDSLRVLEPISLAGKLAGEQLTAIVPKKVIHEPITLNGNYTISGNVTVIGKFKANDLVVGKTNMSIEQTLARGIRVDEPLEAIHLKFEQPLTVNSSLVSFINGQDLRFLLKTNVDEGQLVEGEKLFTGDLKIQGFNEVKILNGIDLEALQPRLLTRTTEQTINASLHIGTIVAKSILSSNITLADHPLEGFLTKSGNQNITGILKVQQLLANSTTFRHLNTNGHLFNTTLMAIYQQKAKNVPTASVFRKGHKFYGTIYVKDLGINSTINGVSVAHIERQLMQLDGNIKYVGDFEFNAPMSIGQLKFRGNLNGIAAEEFGHNWLQKRGAQNFSAPQTIAIMNCSAGLELAGRFNGYHLEEFYNRAYWINRDEHMGKVHFHDPVQMEGALITHRLNGLRVPDDMLFRSSIEPQVLSGELHIGGNLRVMGQILHTTSLNGINLAEFESFLNGHRSGTLHVEEADFLKAPYFQTLNGHDLHLTLNSVWLANENVALEEKVKMNVSHFEGLVTFDGLLNGVNLQFLKDNYFSLSQPQDISTELVFASGVKFQHSVNVHHLRTMGPLVDLQSHESFMFDEFAANTLKTSGKHKITGTWTILEAIVQGNMENVRINRLDLARDVVHNKLTEDPIEITAPKRVKSAFIRELMASPNSLVNNVNISSWIQDAVLVYTNYTIRGVTTLDTVNLYNDLVVKGLVNNITFNELNLMLRDRDQDVHGDIVIRNKFEEEQRMLTINIENLESDIINNLNITEFLNSYAKLAQSQHIQGLLQFQQPLLVGNYTEVESTATDIKWKRGIETNVEDEAADNELHTLRDVIKVLKNSQKGLHHVLDHFAILQTINVENATSINKFQLPLNHSVNTSTEMLFINDASGQSHFYDWNTARQQPFERREDLQAVPQYLQWLASEFDLPLRSFTVYDIQGLQKENFFEIDKGRIGKFIPLQVQREHCFAFQTNNEGVKIHCLDRSSNASLVLKPKCVIKRENTIQIQDASTDRLAVLLPNSVEIWQIQENPQLQQNIPISNGKYITSSVHTSEGISVLALITMQNGNALHRGTIEIYSSLDGDHYRYQQTLKCPEPQQILFGRVERTSDLLLYVLTHTKDQPLIVYQYRGVAFFEKVLDYSTLMRSRAMQIVEFGEPSRHLIALFAEDNITFAEAVLRRI